MHKLKHDRVLKPSNNYGMALPTYNLIQIKSPQPQDLLQILSHDLNLKQPVVLNLLDLNRDDQRELIGLIENHFASKNISFRFPYPVFILTHLEQTISRIPLIKNKESLPRFFHPRDSKINVKESHQLNKNKLIQVEIQNQPHTYREQQIEVYANYQREIARLQKELNFYKKLIKEITSRKK